MTLPQKKRVTGIKKDTQAAYGKFRNTEPTSDKNKKGKTHVYPFHQVRLVRLMKYGKNVP